MKFNINSKKCKLTVLLTVLTVISTFVFYSCQDKKCDPLTAKPGDECYVEKPIDTRALDAKRQEIHNYWNDSIINAEYINSFNYRLAEGNSTGNYTINDTTGAAPQAEADYIALTGGGNTTARKAGVFTGLCADFVAEAQKIGWTL